MSFNSATVVHHSPFSKDALALIPEKRCIFYVAGVFVDPKWDEARRIDHFDNLGQMIPIQSFTLYNVDDTPRANLDILIREAQIWLSNPSNSPMIKSAASWMINFNLSPRIQRGKDTLRSVLAEGIMHLALAGVPFEKYANEFAKVLKTKL